MDCPYIIRENIGFGRVREHGYYQLDEMAYDLTHDFVNADVEVITRALYNVTMESGETLYQLDNNTVFKMLSVGLPVRYVENARDGYIMYSRPESKPAVKAQKVGGITRANKPIVPWCRPAKASQQSEATTPDKSGHWTYPHPIVTNATIDEVGFKAPFVLEVKVHNEETGQYETLYYELDATGFKNATKDVETMVANKWSNWTITKRLLTARFFSNKNGQFCLESSFNLIF